MNNSMIKAAFILFSVAIVFCVLMLLLQLLGALYFPLDSALVILVSPAIMKVLAFFFGVLILMRSGLFKRAPFLSASLITIVVLSVLYVAYEKMFLTKYLISALRADCEVTAISDFSSFLPCLGGSAIAWVGLYGLLIAIPITVTISIVWYFKKY